MDFKTLAAEETCVLHLRDGADALLYEGGDKAKPVTVTLYGPGTRAYAKATADRSNRIVDRLRKKGKADQTPEETAQEQAEFLAACTQSMAYVEMGDLQGEALFRAVYAEPAIGFIAEQAGKHLGDWANFTKGSAKS